MEKYTMFMDRKNQIYIQLTYNMYVKNLPASAGDPGLFPGLERCPGEASTSVDVQSRASTLAPKLRVGISLKA